MPPPLSVHNRNPNRKHLRPCFARFSPGKNADARKIEHIFCEKNIKNTFLQKKTLTLPQGNPHPRQTMTDHTAKTPTQPSRRTQGHGAYSPSPVGAPPSLPHLIIYMGARKWAHGGLPLRNARNAVRTGRRISCGTSETKVAPPSAHPSSPHSRPCTPLQAEAFHPLGRRLAVRGKVASQEATTLRTGGAKFPPVWRFLSSRVEILLLPCGDFFPPVRKFSSSRVEIFLLPYGSFYAPKRA